MVYQQWSPALDEIFVSRYFQISASMRLDHRAGLGFGNTGLCTNAVSIDSTPSEKRHARNLSVTRERYRLIEEKERMNQT